MLYWKGKMALINNVVTARTTSLLFLQLKNGRLENLIRFAEISCGHLMKKLKGGSVYCIGKNLCP
jgi:hypothetical protein